MCCLMCTCMCACVCVCLYVCVEVATCTLTCIKCVPCGAYVSSRLCVNALLCVFVFACAYACVAVLVRVVPMVARRPSARTPSRANRQVQTLGTSCTSNAGLKGSQQLFCGAPRRFVGDGFQHAAVLPSPAAHTTLDTRCTSTSGLKGSQPHFRPSWTLCCVSWCCVRFVDFRNRHSDRRETATYVMNIVCPRVAWANFDVSTCVSSFRFFDPVTG